jgi:hypothetical protein
MNQFKFSVQAILDELRRSLPSDSATAMAIDGNAPRFAIARLARRDGYVDHAERLERALMTSARPGMREPRAA